jgi:hypothetical protein
MAKNSMQWKYAQEELLIYFWSRDNAGATLPELVELDQFAYGVTARAMQDLETQKLAVRTKGETKYAQERDLNRNDPHQRRRSKLVLQEKPAYSRVADTWSLTETGMERAAQLAKEREKLRDQQP